MPHPASLPIEKLLEDCELKRQRRSGPGGQHRNKVETGIVITHLPSELRAEATERRSQEKNRQLAIFRMRLRLAVQLRCQPTDDPSTLWETRRQGTRISVNPEHDDFPTLLAEALDQFVHLGDVREAAQRLSVSTSQLAKLFGKHPPALQFVNAHRREQGLPPLK